MSPRPDQSFPVDTYDLVLLWVFETPQAYGFAAVLLVAGVLLFRTNWLATVLTWLLAFLILYFPYTITVFGGPA